MTKYTVKKKKKKVAEADCLKLLSLPNFFFFYSVAYIKQTFY